jgi:hypothetical protein
LYLENSNEYADFVGVRQEAADSHKSEPISSYIHKLMETLKHKETTRNI